MTPSLSAPATPPQAQTESPPFPKAMMRASGEEFSDVPLQVVKGELPADLHGHAFVIAPIGSVESDGLPNPTGTHLWNGNGMVYRFDFDQPGQARFSTRKLKTPCYYADLATQPDRPYAQYGFIDCGMARFSLHLGMRNALNTALVPFKINPDEPERLLVTFDGGRPYELDPVTLTLITPIGSNQEWRPGLKSKFPFPPVLSTAHPVFDAQTRELFTVNYGRSMANFLDTIPSAHVLDQLPELGAAVLSRITRLLHVQAEGQSFLNTLSHWGHGFLEKLQHLISKFFGIEDFVYLMRWDGSRCDRWKLTLPDGSPVRIEQTMHQVGVSRDYIILADTSLKFGLEQILNNPIPQHRHLEAKLRSLLTRPQLANTAFYLVRRDQLSPSPASHPTPKTVVAQKVVIPLETGHFLVDYDNPQDQVTIHAAHECATDVSEWVRAFDCSPEPPEKPLAPELQGMISVGAMDVGRLGRYVIDAQAGKLLKSQVLADTNHLWGIGLYAVPQGFQGAIANPHQMNHLYWQSLGYWPELLSEFIHTLYQDYPYRLVSVPDVMEGSALSRPSCLMRVDTQTMQIADVYPLPVANATSWDSHIVNSPQFIPKPSSSEEGTQRPGNSSVMPGYLLCPVVSEYKKELWLFDAANLAQGPLCQLSHPSLDFSYTIHSTWLSQLHSPQSDYFIPVREDYEPLVQENGAVVQQLFEEEVYPHFSDSR